jgi:type II secretory pathway component PulC
LLAALYLHTPHIPIRPKENIPTQVSTTIQNMHLEQLQNHIHVFKNPTIAQNNLNKGLSHDDFRFAGTFNIYNPEMLNQVLLRKAVISYHPEGKQYIVSEGDSVGGASVVRIGDREIVLKMDESEITLVLGGRTNGNRETATTTQPGSESGNNASTAKVTRFGHQTESGTWAMDREALLAYYEELLDEPDRLLQVFDSMAPVYMEDGSINGYQLQPVGEKEFFEAVGLQPGDHVKAVNKLDMTNRRRAEFFIRQVVANELNTIVLDIERNGTDERVIYEIK